MPEANPVFAAVGVSIFETMSRLAGELGAINLGQGFPEGLEPPEVIAAAAAALAAGPHQYPPMRGLPELRRAVAEHGARHFGVEADWEREVVVTSGATEALAASLLALTTAGDEVIILEPAYDSYRPIIERAGARAVAVPLEPPHWRLPVDTLAAAITSATRVILLNAPMNPTGKSFDLDELEAIAELARRHDLVVICDEVYEHLVFDGRRHVPLMTLPGMRERCVRIGSAGKSFSVTGWKVGYLTAAPALADPIARAHQYITFTTPPALQRAAALGLALPQAYFDGLRTGLAFRRDLLADGLRDAGFRVLDTEATYFLNIDISDWRGQADDLAFAESLARDSGVAAIPISAFYSDGRQPGLLRLCFAKSEATLRDAVARLRDWRARQGRLRRRPCC